MFRKYTIFLTFFLIAFFSLVDYLPVKSQTSEGLSDLKENHPYYKSISFLYNHDVVEGDGQTGKFELGRILNRAEFATVLSRLTGGYPSLEEYHDCFPDVGTEWFAPYVCYAKKQGLIQGFQAGDLAGKFGPSEPLRYGELLVIMARVADWKTAFGGDQWWEPASYYADQRNIIQGQEFDREARRDVTAEIIFRTLALNALQLGVFDNDTADQFLEYVDRQENFDIAATLRGGSIPVTREEETRTLEDDSTILFSKLTPDPVLANGVDRYTVQFRLRDPKGNDLENRKLTTYLENAEYSFDENGNTEAAFLEYTELGAGYYQVQVTSTESGNRNLVIFDPIGDHLVRKTLTFDTNTPSRFKILARKNPGTNDVPLSEKHYTLAVFDEFWNPIPDAVFTGTASTGTLTMVHDNRDGIAHAVLKVHEYGQSDVEFSASARGQIFTDSDQATFGPLGIGDVPAYPNTKDENITLPLRLFLPRYVNDVESLTLNITLPSSLNLITTQLNSSVFTGSTEMHPQENGGINIRIFGSLFTQEQDSFEGSIGAIVLESPYPQEHLINGDLTLTMTDDTTADLLVNEESDLTVTGNSISTTPNALLTKVVGKSEKAICMDIYVAPDVSITDRAIHTDVEQAETVFTENADAPNCPNYLKIDSEIHRLTDNDWEQMFQEGRRSTEAPVTPELVAAWYQRSEEYWVKIAEEADGTNGNENVSEGEVEPLPELSFYARPDCTKVFYSNTTGTAAGESVRSSLFYDDNGDPLYGVGSYIVLDRAKDRDGLALAHELAQHLSDNQLRTPDVPTAAALGTGRRGNLMSYDRIDQVGKIDDKLRGIELTPAQCQVIDWGNTRFYRYPPEQAPSI